MSSDAGTRESFFPKADAAVLHTKYTPPSPNSRPSEVAPILDPNNANKALDAWSAEVTRDVYPQTTDIWSPAPIPDDVLAKSCMGDSYLFPLLTRNERLRLTMLFYYTRGALEDRELVSRLQEMVQLAQESVGWEFAIAGLLNHNTYTRLVTVGLPLAVLPRRESTCAHTVNQPPGKVFNLLNMANDWRFNKSPHVEQGGLRAYAGVPLRFQTEFGQHVAFGSLCVASNTAQPVLSISQQMSLARLADWIVADIVHSARARRHRERRRMMELLSAAQKQIDTGDDFERVVLEMLHVVYPEASISIQTSLDDQLVLEGGTEVPADQIEHGLWEDGEYFDYLIEQYNHMDPVAPRVVRVVTAQLASQRTPTCLVVGSKDFRVVFDDVDSSFVHMAGQTLCRGWQNIALKEALNAKDNFLRGITHQLRTPIHGILGSVELLAEELGARDLTISSPGLQSAASSPNGDHKDPRTYIKTIRSSARELITTVNSLINLNRWTDIAQAERIVVPHHINEIERVFLNEVVQASTEQHYMRPSIMFKHHFPKDLDTLALDLRLFVDCIQPLIINAVQNTNGGIVCVTTTVTDDYQSLIVDVEDTGRGIRPDNRENIFKAYEKLDPHTPRAGLGLTLASRLATIMNGVVTLVKSEVGKGSHFRATFADPTCAGSVLPSHRKLGSAGRPIFTFDALSKSEEASLSQYFIRYLLHRGHVQSADSDSSISILDYSPEFQYQQPSKEMRPGKAGICLIPDSAQVAFMTDGLQIRREGNVVYVKGPFCSNILEEALDQAHTIRVELESLKNAPEVKVAVEEVVETSASGTTSDSSPGFPTPPSSTSPTPESTDVLTVSLQTLHIEIPSATPTRTSTKPTILIVDDNAVNLRFLEMYCRRRAIPHCTATDGIKAIETFSLHQASAFLPNDSTSDPIELILMDLQMPNCDGIEATRQIRALEKDNGWSKSIIAIVTGQDSLSDRTESQGAGADEFFVKPVGPKVLDRGIREWFPEAKI